MAIDNELPNTGSPATAASASRQTDSQIPSADAILSVTMDIRLPALRIFRAGKYTRIRPQYQFNRAETRTARLLSSQTGGSMSSGVMGARRLTLWTFYLDVSSASAGRSAELGAGGAAP